MKSKNILLVIILSLTIVSCGEKPGEEQPEPLLSQPELITDGYRFTEGPFWHPDGFLLFSDIPANRVYKWTPGEGSDVFIEPSGNSNGIAADTDGHILLAQHAGTVSRLTGEGELRIIADSYEGKRLNSPNDLTVHSSGSIFFTDPPFGVSEEERELEFSRVYKLTSSGDLQLIYDQFTHPNGITFSPDKSRLYVNDSRTGDVIFFETDQDGNTGNPTTFANIGEMTEKGGADGMKTDNAGNLYTTGPNGILVFNNDGDLIYKTEFEEQITNLAWGGPDGEHLFLTASSNVYRFDVNIPE